MAIVGQTVISYSTIGNREDLADVIYDISPTETPFLSGAQKRTATSTYHEWQTDALDAAANNAQVEGDEATANTLSPSTRVGNYTQISRKVVIVSGTARKIDHAGRADEKAYQVVKRGREIKRDMEYVLTQNNASSAGGAATARQSGGLESWLSTNRTSLGTGEAQTTPGYASGVVAAPTDSTVQGTLTKAAIDDVMQKCFTQGGNPTVLMCGPFNRGKVSGLTGISTLETRADSGMDVTLMGAVDFYKSNFGVLRVQPNRFQRDKTIFLLDMEYMGVAILRNMEMTPLAKTGDADKEMLITEYTLAPLNQAASGKITDLTTS